MPKSKDPSIRPIVRLPRDVVPRHYEITLEPDLKRFKFSGAVEICLEATKPVEEIVLNADDLMISEAILTPDNQAANSHGPVPLKIVWEDSSDRVRFVMTKRLPAGTYKLNCKFSANLSDKLSGLYRSSFKDKQHAKHWLCATQLEPMDARRMFPCFDEPDFKATFALKVITAPGLTAISNSEIEKIEERDHKQIITFAPTAKMSSYLLALVVGNFKACGEKTVAGVPIKVWAVSGKEHMGRYALEEAARIFAYQSEYFGIAYPGKKLDLIAVPDFGSEGMENLGAITFNESQLLTDDDSGSIHAKKEITSIIAHEIAHQWFGNLVTMHWWDALWLNEAFATWMATKTSDILHPDWRVLTEAVVNRGGISTDALESTRAIYAKVNTPGDVNEMFDAITYEKGESVLRMLETFVGQKSFREGVHKYLNDHAYGNATTEDLWRAIAACSQGAPVEAIMQSFIYLPGVPIVSVGLSENNHTLQVSQSRYFMLGETKSDNSTWVIPLVMRPLLKSSPPQSTASVQEKSAEPDDKLSLVLKKKADSYALAKSRPGLLINSGGTGYYHTQYSESLFAALKKDFASLTAEEKLTAISDVNALTLSGRVAVEESCDFLLHIRTESDPLVLIHLVRQLSSIHALISESSKHSYEKFVQALVRPLKIKLGWKTIPGESEGQTRLRAAIISLLGTYGQDRETIQEASEYFAQYIKDRKTIAPDIVDSVLTIVSYNGGPEAYEKMLALYRTSHIPKDRELALFNLAGFRDKALADKTLNYAIHDEVRLQDGLELINAVASMKETRPVAWTFIKSHWTLLVNRFPEDHLHNLAVALGHVETRQQEKEVKTWLNRHFIPHARTAIAHMEEEMNLHLLHKEKLGERIGDWLKSQCDGQK